MLRIGLTGGIGSGKSTAAARLAELGATVIDHDLLARQAVAPGSDGLARVAAEFGADVVGRDGTLDRPALGAIVFADPEARTRLNAIVHPIVRRLADDAEAAVRTDDPGAVVVHEIPLLVETGQTADFDLVLVVHASEEVRVERLMRERGLSRMHALARIRAQATDEDRLAAATVVLAGGSTIHDLRRQVDTFWRDRVV
ncbi:MAG TPA: dephospho-CoA kinase [Cellulomonadaceae bacterium]|nr:dephospho-CoA kinase [Cellulomonadaceae bacterium]